jgi:hypothetical protein
MLTLRPQMRPTQEVAGMAQRGLGRSRQISAAGVPSPARIFCAKAQCPKRVACEPARLRPGHVVPKPAQTYEPEVPAEVGLFVARPFEARCLQFGDG